MTADDFIKIGLVLLLLMVGGDAWSAVVGPNVVAMVLSLIGLFGCILWFLLGVLVVIGVLELPK